MASQDEGELKAVLSARRKGNSKVFSSREWEEKRKSQKDEDEKELQELRERQEKRKKERQEREAKLKEQRQLELEAKEKEGEVRKQLGEEEEMKKAAEHEQRKGPEKTPEEVKRNFVTQPKTSEINGNYISPMKSPEVLAADKEKVLAERCGTLDIEGCEKDELKSKASELFTRIQTLLGQSYELEERSKKQKSEIAELTERSSQINKRGEAASSPRREIRGLPTNYRKPDYNKISEKFSQASSPVALTTKFERKLDSRSFADKLKVFQKS